MVSTHMLPQACAMHAGGIPSVSQCLPRSILLQMVAKQQQRAYGDELKAQMAASEEAKRREKMDRMGINPQQQQQQGASVCMATCVCVLQSTISRKGRTPWAHGTRTLVHVL